MNLNEMKKEMLAAYPYRIELHAHSRPASRCSDVEPEELVDIYHKAGYDALVLTNHFLTSLLERGGIDLFLQDYERAARHAEGYGMRVYLGAELRFDENYNDYLLYGVDRETLETAAMYFEKGLAEYAYKGKDDRSLLVQAHPFRKNIEPIDPALVEGVETLNLHSGHNSGPAPSLHYALEHHKKELTAGTDFHHPSTQFPTAALRVKKLPEDSFALAELLRSGDCFFEMEEQTVILP